MRNTYLTSKKRRKQQQKEWDAIMGRTSPILRFSKLVQIVLAIAIIIAFGVLFGLGLYQAF